MKLIKSNIKNRKIYSSSQKGLGLIAIILIAIATYGISTSLFYFFNKPDEIKAEKQAVSPQKPLDSLAKKLGFNIDSLRKHPQFIEQIQKKISENEIFERSLEYSDQEITKEIFGEIASDSIIFITDSLRQVVAKKNLTEEKFHEYIENNKEKFILEKEQKELFKTIETLKAELDTLEQEKQQTLLIKKSKENKIQQLENKNQELKNMTEKITSKNIKVVIKKFESMKPLSAAKIMMNMPDTSVVKLLKSMKPKQAGEVLSVLPATRAANLTAIMMK